MKTFTVKRLNPPTRGWHCIFCGYVITPNYSPYVLRSMKQNHARSVHEATNPHSRYSQFYRWEDGA